MAVFLFATFLFCLSGVGGLAAAYALGRLFPEEHAGRFVLGGLVIAILFSLAFLALPQEVLVKPVFGFFAVGFAFRSFWELMLRQRDKAVLGENAAREIRAHSPYTPGDTYDKKC